MYGLVRIVIKLHNHFVFRHLVRKIFAQLGDDTQKCIPTTYTTDIIIDGE